MANKPERKKITEELLDELLAGEDPKDAFLNGGLIDDLKKAIAKRALNAEMDVHLEREQEAGNHRNERSAKRVITDSGSMEVSIPRDRQGQFEPQLIEKYRRRLPGFDEEVIALYARGMTTREIRSPSMSHPRWWPSLSAGFRSAAGMPADSWPPFDRR